MSVTKVTILLIIIITVVRVSSRPPDCRDEGFTFIEQPHDRHITCGEDESTFFACNYEASGHLQWQLHPQWVINSKPYNSFNLPRGHSVDGNKLIVNSINLEQNNTLYQCQIVHPLSRDGPLCAHRSSVGRLIIQCNAPQIHSLPHYHFKSHNLKKIATKINQQTQPLDESELYNIIYSDYHSSSKCDSVSISSSSCRGGVCSHEFSVNSSTCPPCSDIAISVSVTKKNGLTYLLTDGFTVIDAINNFVRVSYNKTTSIVDIKYINQPKESDKFCEIEYGQKGMAGCSDLSLSMKGHVSHSNSIFLTLNNPEDKSDICFLLRTSNGVESMIVEGTYNDTNETCRTSSSSEDFHYVIYAMFGLATLILLGLSVYIAQLAVILTWKKLHQVDGEQDMDFELKRLELKKHRRLDIHSSKTFFKLHDVTEDCLMHEFAAKHYPHYQPQDGCGYYHVKSEEELKSVKNHKKLILMDEKGACPKYTIVKSAIKLDDGNRRGWKDVYVQELGWKKKLASGSKFLYCARSKNITHRSYWVEHDVTEECRELDFVVKGRIGGYQTGWTKSQYGYFEFTKPEHIEPHQRIIVKKQNGDLVTGPGVRHLVGAMSNTLDEIKPPNLAEHTDREWERVFIQSRELNRKLIPGTKYLFFAMMERISETVHCEVYDIKKRCKMAEFGRRCIPGYNPELGYGFFEFKQEEHLKPHKAVILVDKKMRLFTGAGAQFFCAKDYTSQSDKFTPPNLEKTEWEHIFIQSRSDNRELLPGTKFMYCEYQFNIHMYNNMHTTIDFVYN